MVLVRLDNKNRKKQFFSNELKLASNGCLVVGTFLELLLNCPYFVKLKSPSFVCNVFINHRSFFCQRVNPFELINQSTKINLFFAKVSTPLNSTFNRGSTLNSTFSKPAGINTTFEKVNSTFEKVDLNTKKFNKNHLIEN